MKNIKFILLAASMLFAAACMEKEPLTPAQEETSVYTIEATVGDVDTKSYLKDGVVTWHTSESIVVFDNTGAKKTFTHDYSSEKTDENFGKFSCADWTTGNTPVWAVSNRNNESKVVMSEGVVSGYVPGNQEINLLNSFSGSVNLAVGEVVDNTVEMKNVAGLLTFTTNVRPAAVVIRGNNNENLAGEVTVDYNNGQPTWTIVEGKGEKEIVMTLKSDGKNYTGNQYYVCVLPQTFSNGITVEVMMGSSVAVKKVGSSELVLGRNGVIDLGNFEIPEIEGTVRVAGTYWAKGNLQHNVGSAVEGFHTDWRIAPNQWTYYNASTSPTNVDQYDFFNFGGIEKWMGYSPDAFAAVAPEFNIGGKMFTDQACTTETTDFTVAKYGDIAFWASKGEYRMPSNSEMTRLVTTTVAQYGYYMDGETKVLGWLFREPAVGESAGQNKTSKEFTAEEISKGVFLPITGRRAAVPNSAYALTGVGTDGLYMASNSRTPSSTESKTFNEQITAANRVDYKNAGMYYNYVLHLNTGANPVYPQTTKWAYTSYGGMCIRPVYIVPTE